MTRIILRALNAPALILVIIFGVALQTSLFAHYPLLYLQPDIILVAVIWFALKRSFTEGGILTLILANIAEIHSSTPQGLFLATYMAVFLMIRLVARMLVIPNLPSLTTLTLFASIFWKLFGLFVLFLLGIGANQWRHTLVLLLFGAVMNGVLGIWVYPWLDRFDSITFKSARAQQALEDELQLEGEL